MLIKCKQIGMQTLIGVGSIEKYPISHGNCFSLNYTDGSVRILNFVLENFQKLLDDKTINFPVDVFLLQKGYGMLCDPRIDTNWYKNEMCSVCSPTHLMSIPQLIKKLTQVKSRQVQIFKNCLSITFGDNFDRTRPFTKYDEEYIEEITKLINQKSQPLP